MHPLDLLASLFTLAATFACVILHVISGKHIGLLRMPSYARNGFFALALALLWRAVNLLDLGTNPHSDESLGHINTWGVVAGGALAWSLGSLAWAAVFDRAAFGTEEPASVEVRTEG